MSEQRIQKIAELAGVAYDRAYDWIVDPNGDWSNGSPGVSKEEHDTWTANASDEEIANWLADGAR
jgi:hypothetical protein